MDFEDTTLSSKWGQVALAAKEVIGEVREFEGTKKDLGVRERQELAMRLRKSQVEAEEAEVDYWQSVETYKETKRLRDFAGKRLDTQTCTLKQIHRDSETA